MTRFQYDSLIAVFLDRWRLEMHSFQLPVGEMMVNLEDVAILFGFPLGASQWGLLTSPTLGDWISSLGS
jgi:hypothetical protein